MRLRREVGASLVMARDWVGRPMAARGNFKFMHGVGWRRYAQREANEVLVALAAICLPFPSLSLAFCEHEAC